MADILKHLDLNSADGTQLNLDALYQIAPSAFTEVRDDKTGAISRKVNFEVLRQLLGDHATDGEGEMYQFTWVGKNAARAEAAKPTDKTLRPVVEDSMDWDNTKNIYIEGDNLEVLKLLQRSYMGKVKMIYIDPPYNTGNDFVYHDDFARTTAEEDIEAGNVDELGYRFRKNTDTNGKFHSDWCSMIYSRLLVARSLLAEDGVIFISINDNEVRNLRNICDEVFGEHNFVADLIWTNKEGGGSSDSKLFRIKHEHILCYAKEIDKTDIKGVPISNAERYKGTDEYLSERGPFYLQKMGMGSIQYSSSLDYPIETPDGTTIMPSDNNNGKKACWRWSKDKFERNKALGFVVIKKDSSSVWTVYTKQYMNCDNEGNQLPEETPEDSEARKAGYITIPEIAKERIRRAGAKIKTDFPLTTQNLDTGFRVYRLDESNYEKVSLSPKEYKQDQLDLFANNIKADRTDLDLLYGSMLAWGVRLDLPLQTEIVDGCTIYTVNEGDLVACFSPSITDKVVAAMADKSPLRVLFRDACFKEDAQKINIYEQFKQALDWADNDAFNNIRVI